MSAVLLSHLAERGVKIPQTVADAVAMIEAAKQQRHTPLDGALIIGDAYTAGELTPANLHDRLVSAAEREFLSSPRHGAPLWDLARLVQARAELDIAAWFANSFDAIVKQLAPLFDEQAKIINTLAAKATPEGASAEEVLAAGEKGLEARNQVASAEVAALGLWALLQELAAAASHPVSFAMICDPNDNPLPPPESQHQLAMHVRQGVKLGINPPERVAEIDAAEAARAKQAEYDYWWNAIEADELRIEAFRQRGQGIAPQQGPIVCPPEFEHLKAEARKKHGIILAGERFRNRVA